MAESEFKLGQRVHSAGDPRRIGTVAYVGPVQGYSGVWIGVDWDNGDGKHDGSINGVRYFHAKSERSSSFVRAHNLSSGISLLEALRLRYQGDTTKEEEDEMYVLSASNKRVSVELVGKDKIQDKLSRFEELTGASLSFLGVSSPGSSPCDIGTVLPNLKELDLTGNLLSDWKDVGTICKELPNLAALNISYNLLAQDIFGLPQLKSIRILVLNYTGVNWAKVEVLKYSLPAIEELHLMGNNISTIDLPSFLDIFYNVALAFSLEQLHLNKNILNRIFYPDNDMIGELSIASELHEKSDEPFQNMRCLLLGSNNLQDPASIDALNSFPKLVDIRLSDNPILNIPRFVLIARLEKVEILNGSEVSIRERKESEIRYVRLVMSKLQGNLEDIRQLHPRFAELKKIHGIDDEKPSTGVAGPQKMASGLLSITLKCVGASIGERSPLTKKLPATTTLKILCESFFKLKSIKLKLFLQEEKIAAPNFSNFTALPELRDEAFFEDEMMPPNPTPTEPENAPVDNASVHNEEAGERCRGKRPRTSPAWQHFTEEPRPNPKTGEMEIHTGSPLPIMLDDEMASLMDVGVGNDSTILVDEES
ncbi:Tubulin-specific chaperone E [Morus notabilis]|uniref:Tubulin-specific chaperone E n=1 Tax=Morus notabilis TaxID=981085 RepID=W9RLI1_9ROSA|nr:Tubulin-specific chaperone E [Morus notabilis]